LLLDRGADIKATTKDGWTALHCAARNNEGKEVVQLLLDRGANIEGVETSKDLEDRWTALHHAACYGGKEVLQLLLECKWNIGPPTSRPG